MTTTPAEIAADIAREPFAWPGGYERYAVTDDGGILCYRCCKAEAETIADSYRGDGWHVEAAGYVDADDSIEGLYCDHCNRAIAERETT